MQRFNNQTPKRLNDSTIKQQKKMPFQINETTVAPGENKLIKLNVAKLPSGTIISIWVHVFRSKNPGPTALFMGGLHGDEINGVEIVRSSVADGLFEQLECGSVIAIPLLNVYGFINFSRDAVDGKDVNRSFPGSANGSLASRVARTLSQMILPLVDFGVDFHTGGSSRYNYPQVRYTTGDAAARELAEQFAAPYLMEKKNINKTLRHTAAGMNIPILVYEGGESLRFDGFSMEHGVKGIRRLLFQKKMAKTDLPAHHKPKYFSDFTWMRAEKSGMFMWMQASGAKVSKGEVLGVINSPHGNKEIRVLAKRDGYIVGHNNAPVVNAGDALFHLGW